MKQFKDFKSALNWAKDVINSCSDETRYAVSEQIYKDSKEFTYWQTGEMYKSGELHSNFQKGIIIERSPYVRRRYYEGGVPGGKKTKKIANKKPTYNHKAQPRWFEKAWAKRKNDYQQMCLNIFKQKKGD